MENNLERTSHSTPGGRQGWSSASPEAAQDALVDRVEDREPTHPDDLRVFHLHDARRAASQARSASFSVSAIACS